MIKALKLRKNLEVDEYRGGKKWQKRVAREVFKSFRVIYL